MDERIGQKKTLAVFFMAGVLSLFVGIPFYSPDTRIVGASIAVSAIVEAVLVLAADKSSPLLLFAPLGLIATIYLIFNGFTLVYDQTGGIAYQPHIVSFLNGRNPSARLEESSHSFRLNVAVRAHESIRNRAFSPGEAIRPFGLDFHGHSIH